jgi:DegV family protein with EDD domain
MKIVTDCAADMSSEELQELGVVQAPLLIQFPEGEINSADLTPDEFYDRLEAMRPDIPTTSQPSSGFFADMYSRLARVDPEILSIHISSGLSGTISAARLGGEDLNPPARIRFWDTLTLSGGQRFQVLAAALAARAGWALETIEDRLARIRERTEVIYTLDTLEYLARGGRIGRVKALAGALLHLKPLIRVDSDGRYSTVGTARTLSKSISDISEHLHHRFADEPVWVTVLHGRLAEKAQALVDNLRGRLNITRLELRRISPVLGVHTGPGIVGAAVTPMELMQGLV